MNWSKPESLARHHASIACVLWAAVIAVYFPVTIWSFFFAGGLTAAWWAVWVAVVTVSIATTVVNLVRAWQAPVTMQASEAR